MKYEFKFKVKERGSRFYETKYSCTVGRERFLSVKSSYEKLKAAHPEWDSVILINELTDDGEFLQVIQ